MEDVRKRTRQTRSRAVVRHVDASCSALVTVARDRDLRAVQLAWSGCITAEGVLRVVLAVVAYRGAGALGVGLVILARAVPAAAIGPFAAAVADRFRRERVLLVVLVGRVVTFAAVAGALLADAPLEPVFAIAALDAVLYSTFWPAHSSLLPLLAQTPARLTVANVTSTTIRNLGNLVGPIVGGAVMAAASPAVAVEVGAVALGLSALVLVQVQAPATSLLTDGAGPDAPHVLAGFRTLVDDPAPRLVVLLYGAQLLCLGGISVIVAALALDVHGAGEPAVGYLMAAVGAGGTLGALGSLVLVGRPRLGRALFAALLLWALALLATALAPSAIVVGLFLAALGAANAVIDVAALTLLQRLVRDHVLIRVLGVLEGLTWSTLGAGAIAASLLSDLLGVRPAIGVIGCVLPALGLLTAGAMSRVDARATVDARAVQLLAELPMFRGLSPPALEGLAFAAERSVVPAGKRIIREGDVGEQFYVIEDGEVAVDSGRGPVRLGRGTHFGEIALLRSIPRTATVTAARTTELVALRSEDFLAALAGHHTGREVAEAGVRAILDDARDVAPHRPDEAVG